MNGVTDKLWIWGQSPDTHYVTSNGFGLPGRSLMTAREGCAYLGVRNCLRVRSQGKPAPPFDQESMALDTLERVVWSLGGAYELPVPEYFTLDEVARQAREHENIVGGILDDLFVPERYEYYIPGRLRDVRARLCEGAGRELPLWTVCHEGIWEDAPDVKGRLDAFDTLVLWTGRADRLAALPESLDRLTGEFAEKTVLVCCCLWDFGGRKAMDMGLMRHQYDVSTDYLRSGRIGGIVFCSNGVVDLGLEAVAWTRERLEALQG